VHHFKRSLREHVGRVVVIQLGDGGMPYLNVVSGASSRVTHDFVTRN
jgi:hypothetical protein